MKSQIRENRKNQDSTCVLSLVFTIGPNSGNDPMVDTQIHSGTRVRPKTQKNDKCDKRALSLKNNNPGLKADFPNKSENRWNRHNFTNTL